MLICSVLPNYYFIDLIMRKRHSSNPGMRSLYDLPHTWGHRSIGVAANLTNFTPSSFLEMKQHNLTTHKSSLFLALFWLLSELEFLNEKLPMVFVFIGPQITAFHPLVGPYACFPTSSLYRISPVVLFYASRGLWYNLVVDCLPHTFKA